MPPYLLSKETFAEFLRAFLSGELPRAEWNHAAHLAVAAATLYAGGNIRERILAYNATQGIVSTPDYDETLTRFWADRIQELLPALGRDATDFDAARAAVAAFALRARLFDAYYSFDLFTSREARAIYVPPDK
jgi:hypothetical protein